MVAVVVGNELWWAMGGSVGFVFIYFVSFLWYCLSFFFNDILMYCIYYFNVLFGIIEYLM